MNADIKITADGDLILGNQMTDASNKLLFYTSLSPEAAGIVTNEPNENSIPMRDMDIVYSDERNLQLISTRFRTDQPDWYLYPNLGANISELAGELNSEDTALKGRNMIMNSITQDNAFDESDITIMPIPVSINEILYDIRIMSEEAVSRYTFLLNLEIGVLNYYEVNN